MNPLLFSLYISARCGLFIPTADMPYIDSLPLDYPRRLAVIGDYHARASQDMYCDYYEMWWTSKWATRLFLINQLQEYGPDQAGYMLGRMQGRNMFWGEVWSKRDMFWKDVWLDEWDGE